MSINLVLSAFESNFTLQTSATLPDYEPALGAVDATIDLSVNVPLATIRNTFYYRTDDPITSDASFVYYYVDKSAWGTFSGDMNPFNGTVTDGYYGSNTTDDIGKDFLRELAKQLFSTYIGADLFTNEDAVVTDISTRCGEVATAIDTLMANVDVTATLQGPDGNGEYYKKDDTATTNLTREILNQMLDVTAGQPTRFDDVTVDAYTAKGTGYFHVPFAVGDTLSFKLTVSPKADQHTVIATGLSSMASRAYRVRMTVGA